MKQTKRFSKSRGGCQRCKSKHMKCDETKPACQMCTVSGVECPGFSQPLKWSSKHEVFGRPSKRRRQEAESDSQGRESEKDNQDSAPNGLDALPPSYDTAQGTEWTNDRALPYEWPDFESLGYEDLGFSTELPIQSMDSGLDVHFGLPFFNPPFGEVPEALDPTSFDEQGRLPESSSNQDIENQDANESSNGTAVSSNSGGLLRTFYRLSVPNKVPGFSEQHLVNYYFNNVCAIYSCFDSDLNPFRTLVSELWSTSSTVFFTIQSMSLSHLANYYPYMAPKGITKRSQAWKSLQRDLHLFRSGKRNQDQVLLSLLLMGLSSSWHQASNLGMQYLFIARNIMHCILQDPRPSDSNESSQKERFFEDALIYWEMLASFVDPVPMIPFSGVASPILDLAIGQPQRVPHPWTGIITEVHFALAEIGRVLRRQRNPASILTLRVPRNTKLSPEDEEWARSLEKYLCSAELPPPDGITDYDDDKTAKTDLIRTANAHRFIGLLELYRVFPSLLWERIEKSTTIGLFEFRTCPDGLGHAQKLDSRLSSIAKYILDEIKPIPVSSAACRQLPIALVAAASQLRIPDSTSPLDTQDAERIHDDAVEARYLVEARMLVLSRKYPQRPLLQMIDIVKEVWQRLDDGTSGAHWIDVAHEKGWQTMMG